MNLYMPGLQNFVAALIPMIMGMIWYSPKAFGNIWMKGARLTQDDAKGINMPLLMGVGYILALVITMQLKSYAIFHEGEVKDQTFLHGAFHSVMFGLMVGIPIMISSTLWEKKSLAYYLINTAYWIVTLALMGGVMFAWRSGYAEVWSSMNAAG